LRIEPVIRHALDQVY